MNASAFPPDRLLIRFRSRCPRHAPAIPATCRPANLARLSCAARKAGASLPRHHKGLSPRIAMFTGPQITDISNIEPRLDSVRSRSAKGSLAILRCGCVFNIPAHASTSPPSDRAIPVLNGCLDIVVVICAPAHSRWACSSSSCSPGRSQLRAEGFGLGLPEFPVYREDSEARRG
jgi:hypothetical protein